MLFSILICTFNGAEKLPATLKATAALKIPQESAFELLVVNNGSTDNTYKVVRETWEGLGSPFSLALFDMPIVGKGNALALGIREARGDYVVICDDDNWLSEDYLQEAEKYLTKHTEASILAGKAVAVSDNPLPEWFAEKQWAYACGQQYVPVGNATGYNPLWSAGMIIQRTLADIIFNSPVAMLLLGRTGTQLISGEDDEICYRAWLLGRQTHYVPTLLFKHYMAPHRLTIDYFDKLLAGFAYQSNAVGAYRRFYQVIQYRGNRFILFIKKWMMFQWYRISNDTCRAAIANDTLYFLSGSRYWETPENKQVKRFYDEVVMDFSLKK